jgi:hypothetical protein
MAEAIIITGSGILKRNKSKTVTTAIDTESISINCLFASTITAPAIAPIAAVVTPSTKALIPGFYHTF